MSMTMQILSGSILLLACVAIHVFILATTIASFISLRPWLTAQPHLRRWLIILGVALTAIIVANTIEVWLFAVTVHAVGALPTMADAVYFVLVTYTTLGYGDVVLEAEYRIFGAFAAIAGLLVFGLSTAFLVKLFGRLVPHEIDVNAGEARLTGK